MLSQKIEEIDREWKEYLGMEDLAGVPMLIDMSNKRAKPLGIYILNYVEEDEIDPWLEKCAYECRERGLSRVGEIYIPSNIELNPSLPKGWHLVKECSLDGVCEYALLNEEREKYRGTPECWKEDAKRVIENELKKLENRKYREILRENIEELAVELVDFEKKRKEGKEVLKRINTECFYNYSLHEPSEFTETLLCYKDNKAVGVISLEYMPNGIVEYSISVLPSEQKKNTGTAMLSALLEEKEFNILYGDITNTPSAKALIRARYLSGKNYALSYGVHNLQADINSVTMDYMKYGRYIDTLPIYLRR